MKEEISQLMDGELAGEEAARALAVLKSDREAFETWRTYHLISDSLRETRVLSRSFTERVAARLAAEPVVVAPGRWSRVVRASRSTRAAVGAVVAALAFVALTVAQLWAPEPESARAPLAAAPEPLAPPPEERPAAPDPAGAALPEAARDYLLAHQGYAPRYAPQGYARSVSDIAGRRR
ncbi:MAG: sigma-E factor negative regulatory protein [Burkholderiales bacterium]|nr:sigma-E factor negative regulatory protein [Burkholderiales bacterium]